MAPKRARRCPLPYDAGRCRASPCREAGQPAALSGLCHPVTDVTSLSLDYPDRIPSVVPAGKLLAHNNAAFAARNGTRGFRFWLTDTDPRYKVCPCDWAPELSKHYKLSVG
jgi:hypothetical protein